MLESSEMFSSLPLNPNNDWINLSKFGFLVAFDLEYADIFRSKNNWRADSRTAKGLVLNKICCKGTSNENLTKKIVMNLYLQFFLGLRDYRS